MIGWIKRAGGIVAAAIGLLLVGVLALGLAANTIAGLIGVVASLPHWVVVTLWTAGPLLVLIGVWSWAERKPRP